MIPAFRKELQIVIWIERNIFQIFCILVVFQMLPLFLIKWGITSLQTKIPYPIIQCKLLDIKQQLYTVLLCCGIGFTHCYLLYALKCNILKRHVKNTRTSTSKSFPPCRLSFATDIARGMSYLHQHKMFHGRLHSRNCVIDDRWVCKISGDKILQRQSILLYCVFSDHKSVISHLMLFN